MHPEYCAIAQPVRGYPMKHVILAALAIAFLSACAKSDNEDISARNSESKERPNFGSATDIARADGTSVNTNSANVADNGIGGAPQRQAGNYQSQPLPDQSSDTELAKQIKVALTTGSMGTTGVIAENQLTRIDVQVNNGVATLSGPAATEDEKRSIGKQVSGMKGVRSVVNNLTVGGRSVKDRPLQPLVPRGNQ
jgi:hypothetical protein